MAQQNRIQDGTVVFSTADPTSYDLGFNIQGNANITKALVVAQSNVNDGRISTSTGTDLLLTVEAGAPANIRLETPTGGNVLINNIAWIDNTPNLGGFIGASATNLLHYYPFVAGNEVSDTLTTSYLNTTYPNIVPGQMVVGSTVVYLNVGLGTWRYLSNGGGGGGGSATELGVYTLTGTTTGTFSGGLFNSWNFVELKNAPSITADSYLDRFTFSSTGYYQITVSGVATSGLSSWPDQMTAFGSSVSGTVTVTSAARGVHTRFGNNTGFTYMNTGLDTDNKNTATWTDTFVVYSNASGNYVMVNMFTNMYSGSGTTSNFSGTVTIQKL